MKRTGLAVVLAAATVAALAAAGSAAPTPPPKPEARLVKALRGTCDIAPVGKQVINAELALTLPTSVTVGTSVWPKDIKLKIVFPAEMVAALKEKQIAAIEGIAGVQLKATAESKPVDTPARGPLPSTPLPETGPLTVELPAKVAAEVPTTKPGKVSYALGSLELLLAKVKTAEEPTGEATPVACVPEEGQDNKLGTVSVFAPTPTTLKPTAPRSSAAAQSPSTSKAPGAKKPGDKREGPGGAAQDEEPCANIPPDAFFFWSYYDLSGRAEVRKLKSGIDFGPGYLSAQLFFWFEGEIACGAVFGDLLWPPASGSFVAFGFVPTTAVVTVVPVGRTEGRLADGVFTGVAKVHLVLSDVKVNGTPLPVGRHCQTAEPVVMNLKSVLGEWDVFTGGTIETDVTIPAFRGCGVTEPLDPLFTGLISGPGNHAKLTFGNINFCEPSDQPCVPPLPGRR